MSGLSRGLGPMISVVAHVAIVIVLLKVLVFRAPKEERAIDVRVVEAPAPAVEEVEPPPEPEEIVDAADALEAPAEVENELPAEESNLDSMLESELDLSGLDSVAEIESPLTMTGLMVGRSDAGRSKMLREFGGRHGGRAEKAVLKALDWLKTTQRADGAWGVGTSKSMTARQERARLTGLALLCYLAHGETSGSAEYGDTVRRGVAYLLAQQDKSGRFCPFSKTVGSHDDIGVYGHAIATYALAEAYALTRSPALKDPLAAAVKVIVKGQQPGGGWDHRYQHAKWSDLSVTGWQVQALKAAAAAAVEVEGLNDALARSALFVRSMHDEGGKFFYRVGNKTPSSGLDYMTGAAVLCLQLTDQADAEEVRDGLGYLRDKECSEWDEGWEKTAASKSFNIAYEWYYNTQAIFQKGGSKWASWNNKFAPMLIEAQDASGAWKPPAEKGAVVSKDIIYTTEFCCLSLQVYYRILPSFKKAARAAAPFEFENDVRIVVVDAPAPRGE